MNTSSIVSGVTAVSSACVDPVSQDQLQLV
jgi:hypothetical protein